MPNIEIAVPDGYALVRTAVDQGVRNFGGFGSLKDPAATWTGQRAHAFVRGNDWRTTMVIFVAPPDSPALALVRDGKSEHLSLNAGEIGAEYHSGIWSAASEPSRGAPAAPTLAWNQDIHSLTVTWPTHKVAVRAPAEVSLSAMIAAAMSVDA